MLHLLNFNPVLSSERDLFKRINGGGNAKKLFVTYGLVNYLIEE